MNAATENEMHDGGGTTRPPRGKLVVVALVVAALLGVGLWLSYRPVPGQLQGMVDAREIRVTSKVTGRIASFGVEEGQPVRQGQLLYTISSPEVAAKQQQAGGALEAAQATQDKAEAGARSEDIRAAEAQWRRAQAAANLAQDTSNRTQRLFAGTSLSRVHTDFSVLA